MPVVSPRKVVQDAELCALSNGAIFNRGHRLKMTRNPEKNSFFEKLEKYIWAQLLILPVLASEKVVSSLEINSALIGVNIIESRRTKFVHPSEGAGVPRDSWRWVGKTFGR